ncbi:TPA: polysaccharide pyruvyl transferase family protein [Photobacterium damselae]
MNIKKKIKVCLLWHNINSENFGVSALAIAHIKMLIDAAEECNVKLEIHSIGTPDIEELAIKKQVEEMFSMEIEHCSFSVQGMLRGFLSGRDKKKYFDYDLFFDIGEGDSFSDIYGLKRFFILSISKILPILKGKKVILSPQTYGPFYSNISRVVSRFVINKAYKVYSRDFKSSKILDDLNCDYEEVADVAFSLPYKKEQSRELSVGINVSALLYNGGYNGNNQFNLTLDYPRFINDLINYYLDHNYEVHLVPHVLSESLPVEDDYETSKIIKSSYFASNARVIMPEKFKSPIDAKSYISTLSLFLGSRMHATIGSISSGVPTIPLAYSRKFSGVFGSIDYNHTLNLYELEIDECLKRIDELTKKRNELYQSCLNSKKIALDSNEKYKKMLQGLFKSYDK